MRKLLSPPSLVLKYGGQALSHSRGLTLSPLHRVQGLSSQYLMHLHPLQLRNLGSLIFSPEKFELQVFPEKKPALPKNS
jgi:hypothetical protein